MEEQRFRIDEEQVEREEAVNSIVAIVRTFIARQRYLRVLKLEDDKAWELAVREENAAHRLGLWGRGWLDRHGGARNATKGKKESVLVEEVATKDETASTLTNKAVETPAQSHGGAKSVEVSVLVSRLFGARTCVFCFIFSMLTELTAPLSDASCFSL